MYIYIIFIFYKGHSFEKCRKMKLHKSCSKQHNQSSPVISTTDPAVTIMKCTTLRASTMLDPFRVRVALKENDDEKDVQKDAERVERLIRWVT